MLHARTAPTGCCDISYKAARHIACSAAALSYISSVFGRPSGTASASNCFNHHKGTNNISKQNIFVAIFLQIVIFLPQKLLLCNIHCINNRRLTPARRPPQQQAPGPPRTPPPPQCGAFHAKKAAHAHLSRQKSLSLQNAIRHTEASAAPPALYILM